MNHKLVLIFGLIFLNSLGAQTKPSITQLVDKYFDFTPCGATQEVINAKSKQLDEFWNIVLADKASYEFELRNFLYDYRKDDFVLYDGAMLLLKIANSPANLQAAVSAISRVKLCGINQEDYFKTAMYLANKGYYVGDVIKKILAEPEFVFYLAAHGGYAFDQSLSVLYLSLLSVENRIIPLLEEQIKTNISERSQAATVMALGFMVNKDALKILMDLGTSAKSPKIREMAVFFSKIEDASKLPKVTLKTDGRYFTQFLDDFVARKYSNPVYDFPTYMNEAPYWIRKSHYAKIKNLIRDRCTRVSNEGVEEIKYLTYLLQFAYSDNN